MDATAFPRDWRTFVAVLRKLSVAFNWLVGELTIPQGIVYWTVLMLADGLCLVIVVIRLLRGIPGWWPWLVLILLVVLVAFLQLAGLTLLALVQWQHKQRADERSHRSD